MQVLITIIKSRSPTKAVEEEGLTDWRTEGREGVMSEASADPSFYHVGRLNWGPCTSPPPESYSVSGPTFNIKIKSKIFCLHHLSNNILQLNLVEILGWYEMR